MTKSIKKFILAEKQHMTQVFDKDGVVHPVTVVSSGPMVVTQVKSKSKDGYDSVQIGYGTKAPKNISKALKGHMKDLGEFRHMREFKTDLSFNVGDKLEPSQFVEGDVVTVTSISKGKGFQGVVKRHGFAGGPRTHGQKHSEREPGSISGNTRNGGRVPKGMRMAGRMGGDTITQKNLKVIGFDDQGQILISGAIAGRRGTLVAIKA